MVGIYSVCCTSRIASCSLPRYRTSYFLRVECQDEQVCNHYLDGGNGMLGSAQKLRQPDCKSVPESNGRSFEGRNNERPSIYGRGMSDNRTTTATDPGLSASSKTWSRDYDSADHEAWLGSMWDAGERCGRGLRMRFGDQNLRCIELVFFWVQCGDLKLGFRWPETPG